MPGKRPPGPGRGHKIKQGSGIPAGGNLGMRAVAFRGGYGTTGENANVLDEQGGREALAKAEEIVKLPLREPMRDNDGNPVLGPDGQPVMLVVDSRLSPIVNAAQVVMNRRLGAVVQKTVARIIRGPEDLTDDELRAFVEGRGGDIPR